MVEVGVSSHKARALLDFTESKKAHDYSKTMSSSQFGIADRQTRTNETVTQ